MIVNLAWNASSYTDNVGILPTESATKAKAFVERRNLGLEVLIPKPGVWYVQKSPTYSGSALTGPYHDDGDPWQVVKLTLDELNTFVQGGRIEQETSVFHQKVDGKVYVIPALKNAKMISTNPNTGLSTYEIEVSWLSGGSSFKKTIQTTLNLLLTGEEAFGYKDSQTWPLYHAYVTKRIDYYSYVTNYVHTFVSGAWGDRWYPNQNGLAIKVTHVDYVTCTTGSIPKPWPALDETGLTSGQLSVEGGIVAARSSIAMKQPSENSQQNLPKLFLKEQDFSMADVRLWVRKLVHPDLLTNLPSLNLEDWGDLAHKASSNLDANSANMIAFVKDLRNVKDLMPKLKELGKLKTHAGNYLAAEYGVLPTIGDLKSIYEAFKVTKYMDRSGYRRVSAYDMRTDSYELLGKLVPIQHTRRLHLAVNENDTGLDSLTEKARSIGVFPSLNNLWDLVPYSFVLDWFIDVGSVLERIDTIHRLINLDIPYVIQSDRIEASVSMIDTSVGAGIALTLTSYRRDVTRSVPQPRIFGEIGKPPTVQNHWIEGSALILQRTK